MVKPDAVAVCNTSFKGAEFFKCWLSFLKPYHSLSAKELRVAACFLKKRHELSKVISDDALIDRILLNWDNTKAIREECDVSVSYFGALMHRLRKNDFIKDNRINPRFIPRLKTEDGEKKFSLMILFNIEDGESNSVSTGTKPEEE